jgi:hypothetical protein
MMLNGSGF